MTSRGTSIFVMIFGGGWILAGLVRLADPGTGLFDDAFFEFLIGLVLAGVGWRGFRNAARPVPDHGVTIQSEQKEENNLRSADEAIEEEALSPRAGHWPERNQSGFPQVTLEAWLWWPEIDDWENATLTATVTPATSDGQIETFHLAIEKGDRVEHLCPKESNLDRLAPKLLAPDVDRGCYSGDRRTGGCP